MGSPNVRVGCCFRAANPLLLSKHEDGIAPAAAHAIFLQDVTPACQRARQVERPERHHHRCEYEYFKASEVTLNRTRARAILE